MPRRRAVVTRRKIGILLPSAVIEDIQEIGRALGLPPIRGISRTIVLLLEKAIPLYEKKLSMNNSEYEYQTFCTKCRKPKPLEEFRLLYDKQSKSTYRHSWCTPCENAIQRERNRKRYEKTKELQNVTK